VLHLDGRGGAWLHTGGASELMDELTGARDTQPGKPGKKKPARAKADSEPDRPKKLTYMEQRELEQIGGRIEELEGALAALDEQLSDTSLYEGDGRKARELHERRAEAATTLDQALARWEELAERDA